MLKLRQKNIHTAVPCQGKDVLYAWLPDIKIMNDYTLGIEELDNAVGGIKKGSNIMLIGPPMSGKETILRQIMYHGDVRKEDAIITVTTRESGTHILDREGKDSRKKVNIHFINKSD